jgi:hypothetical protein
MSTIGMAIIMEPHPKTYYAALNFVNGEQ